MPSKTPAQHRFMEMVAHDPAAAKRVGVPQRVGREFVEKDCAGREMVAKDAAKGCAISKHLDAAFRGK